MPLQILLMCERLGTVLADIGSFPCVNCPVVSETCYLVGAVSALQTFVSPSPVVVPDPAMLSVGFISAEK